MTDHASRDQQVVTLKELDLSSGYSMDSEVLGSFEIVIHVWSSQCVVRSTISELKFCNGIAPSLSPHIPFTLHDYVSPEIHQM